MKEQHVYTQICPTCGKPMADLDQVVVTVRMPKELHERLQEASHKDKKSMNRICVEVLNKYLPKLSITATVQ